MSDAIHGDTADDRSVVARAIHRIAEADHLSSSHWVGEHRQRNHAWFDHLRATHAGLWTDLERAIRSFVHHERARERRPEQVIVVLKRLIDDASLDHELKQEVERDVIRWGIDAYYAR